MISGSELFKLHDRLEFWELVRRNKLDNRKSYVLQTEGYQLHAFVNQPEIASA